MRTMILVESNDNLNALFTVESLLSLQGSAAAALIVPNVLQYLFGDSFEPYTKWVSFVISMALSYLVAALAPPASDGASWLKWVLAFFNGFLVFASALGINEGIGRGILKGRSRFFKSWLD